MHNFAQQLHVCSTMPAMSRKIYVILLHVKLLACRNSSCCWMLFLSCSLIFIAGFLQEGSFYLNIKWENT